MLQFQELSTHIQTALEADLHVNLSLPVGADALAQSVLRHTPPRPLEIEQAIELVEDAVMPARAQLPAALRLQSPDVLLRAMAAGVAKPVAPPEQVAEPAGNTIPAAQAPLWLSTDAVEHLFNRLAARAEGRPATQDDVPVDGPNAARLVIVRELMHHWALDGLLLT
jgi:hypothetical protein